MKTLLKRIKTFVTPVASSALLFFTGIAVADATTCANGTDSGCLGNPLNTQFSTIPTFIAGSLKVVVLIALPIIVLFFVVAGFKFISAQGNPGKLDEARKNFMWVVIGALLILGAWVLATLIAGTVSQLVAP